MDQFLERHKLLKLTQETDIITNRLPVLINEFNNVAGYNINIDDYSYIFHFKRFI